jgi:predicted CXXCH cytochrome family protein
MTRGTVLLLGAATIFVAAVAIPVESQAPAAQAAPPAPAATPAPQPAAQQTASAATYVGSQACRRCHAPTYERWSKTRMANVVLDPKVHPEAVLGDFSLTSAARDFTVDDVAFTYGSKWKQRYFKKVGDDYFPLGAQWDVMNRVWRPYNVAPNTDWWTAHYGPTNDERPTGPLCDGCHSVNYDIKSKQVTEWNVGCERCHGPGSEHVARPTVANIVNPAKLDFVRANDTCIQCHSQGQPLNNPIEGKYYDWPVGFNQGGQLKDFWTLEEHKLGETTFTHFAEGTAHKNRMQGNDYVQSTMYKRGVTCFGCHDVHGTANNADTLKPARDLCVTCHGPASPSGPHAPTIEAHTHHTAGSAGSQCVSCHMPQIEQTIANVNVRSHTFEFITPTMTDEFKVPNPCTSCHTDKTTDWARAALKGWSNMSPWRIAE